MKRRRLYRTPSPHFPHGPHQVYPQGRREDVASLALMDEVQRARIESEILRMRVQQAYIEGMRSGGGITQRDVEHARMQGFREGLTRGHDGAASSQSRQSNSEARAEVIDEVLEKCRVISESNPQMAPGVNAVRHLVKKLKKQ